MAWRSSIITRCHDCQVDSVHNGKNGWQVRITVMPDEKFYATFPCSNCGEWRSKQIGVDEILLMRDDYGVPVEDLSLIEPGLERDTMPPATPSLIAHMCWVAYDAKPEARQAILVDAAMRCLYPEHPAGGA